MRKKPKKIIDIFPPKTPFFEENETTASSDLRKKIKNGLKFLARFLFF
ncbi:MAG: hypothetical protein KY055_00220 [Candidatus Nealsonbacteria bacterium]|nr:hypothetical protein [Candidatus Nealsonbacteria bacterium]